MSNLFTKYLEEAIEKDNQQQTEQNSEQVEKKPDGTFASDEDFQKKKDILTKWIKQLNQKFAPYAVFQIITEINDNDSINVYLSMKSKDIAMDRHFYHITPEEDLTKAVYEKIIQLADEKTKVKTYN